MGYKNEIWSVYVVLVYFFKMALTMSFLLKNRPKYDNNRKKNLTQTKSFNLMISKKFLYSILWSKNLQN